MDAKAQLLQTKPELVKRTVAGVEVYFAPLSRALFKQCLELDDGDETAVVNSACNQDGSPMFTQDEVGQLPMPVFRELVAACLEANGVNTSKN